MFGKDREAVNMCELQHQNATFRKAMDWVWLIYFVQQYLFANAIRFNHYLATLFLVGATIICYDWKLKFSKNQRVICAYACIFTIWIIASAFWSSGWNDNRKTVVISIVENLIMVFCLLNYVNDYGDLVRMIRVFIYSTSIMCIVYYTFSPIDTWGTTRMGTRLAIWRNAAGYYFAFTSFLAMYQYYAMGIKKKRLILLGIMLAIGSVGTGSRKTIVHLAMCFVLNYVLQKGVKRRIGRFCRLGAIGVALLIVGYQIPFIREGLFDKLKSMLGGINSQNSSTATRAYMIKYGFELWKDNLILGAGVDEYRVWIARKVDFLQRYAMTATYSHCNFVELLANNGLIGLFLYYGFPVCLIWKNKKGYNDLFVKMGIILLVVFVVLDYATISYYMKFNQIILYIGIMALSFTGKREIYSASIE